MPLCSGRLSDAYNKKIIELIDIIILLFAVVITIILLSDIGQSEQKIVVEKSTRKEGQT